MPFFRSKAGHEAIFLGVFGTVIWALGSQFQAFEAVTAFVLRNDDYQLDDLALAITVTGLVSLIYSILRLRDLSREVGRREIAEQGVKWISGHDETTALPNRRSLDERMACPPPSGEDKLGVFAVQLDGFKKIKDLFDHKTADDVLRVMAERLKAIFPPDDIFRTGGRDFVAFIAGADHAEIAEQVAAAIARPVGVKGQAVEVGVTIGYALLPVDGTDMASAVRCAEVAMEAAKNDPARKIRAFEPTMRERWQESSELEKQLRHAVRKNTIRPYYQPIVDLHTGRINGFEALARWEQEPGKFVPPTVFIDLAERTGLIGELTVKLFRMACADAATWSNGVILSFNLSPTQLHDGLLAIRILTILSEAGLPPSRLEIEITESALIQDLVAAERIIADLKNAGIRIALDDFGTGYSSLGQLSRFSFDKIKIDRMFVSEATDGKKNEKILRTIIGLGKGLDILTTAEGIETEEQLQALIRMGCNLGQGYLFGKAVPAAEASRLLELDCKLVETSEMMVA